MSPGGGTTGALVPRRRGGPPERNKAEQLGKEAPQQRHSGVARLAHPASAPFSRDGSPREVQRNEKQGCCRPTTWKQHLGFWACRGSLESGRGYEPGRDRRSHRSSSTRQARSLQHRQHVRGLNPATAAEASREETTGRAPGSAGAFREESRGFENGRRSGPALASTGGCPGRCRPNNPRPPYREPDRRRRMHPGEPASRGFPGSFCCRNRAARRSALRRHCPASLPAFAPPPAAAPLFAAPEPVPIPRGSSRAA